MRRLPWIVVSTFTAFAALALAPAGFCATEPARLLAVFAHPDDEISVAPLLARYAAEGHDVHLVTVTSGQVGDSNTNIARGKALGAAREKELACSGKALGIHPPRPLGFQDGDIAAWETLEAIRESLREIVREIRPQVMVTWGQDGLSGHPDHRLVAAVATEVFQERWDAEGRPPQKLYAFALPLGDLERMPGPQIRRTAVRPELVTTAVDGSAYLDQTLAAMQCHVTQWAPSERIEQMFAERKKASGGKVSLRLVMSTVPTQLPETDILAGLAPLSQ